MTTPPVAPAAPPSGEGDKDRIPSAIWKVCAVIVMGAFMANLDASLVNVGLATIARDLDASLTQAQWTVSGYLLALAGMLPACGWFGRRFGAVNVWLWALMAFAVTSAVCAFAPTITALIGARVLQGMAGGLLVPSGQTALGQTAGPARMNRVMSTVGVAVVLAPAIGPACGGLIISGLSWRWLFLINLPVALVAVALGLRLVRRGLLKPVRAADAGQFDVPGFLLIALALPLLTYGIIEVSSEGRAVKYSVLGEILVGVLLLALFVRRGLRHHPPLMNLRLFSNPVYRVAQCCGGLTSAAGFGGLVIMPLYFQVLRHETVAHTGLLLIPYGVGAAFGLRLGGSLGDRFGNGVVLFWGVVLTIVTTLPFVFMDAEESLTGVELLTLIRGVGFGLTAIRAMTTAYATVASSELPDAATQANILQRIGGSLGSALFVVILTSYGGVSAHAFQMTFLGIALTSGIALIASAQLARTERRWHRVTQTDVAEGVAS